SPCRMNGSGCLISSICAAADTPPTVTFRATNSVGPTKLNSGSVREIDIVEKSKALQLRPVIAIVRHVGHVGRYARRDNRHTADGGTEYRRRTQSRTCAGEPQFGR